MVTFKKHANKKVISLSIFFPFDRDPEGDYDRLTTNNDQFTAPC